MADERCENCRFWDKINTLKATDHGFIIASCRRYPPSLPIQGIAGLYECTHPDTLDSQWCGEWQAVREMEAVQGNDLNTILQKQIGFLDLGFRATKHLRDAAITDVRTLVEHSSQDLLDLGGFGMTSLSIVREKLSLHGLHLKGE